MHKWELLPPLLGEGQATHAQLRDLLGGNPSPEAGAALYSWPWY